MAIDQGWLILRDQEGDDEVEMSELERNHSALGNVCKVCCFFPPADTNTPLQLPLENHEASPRQVNWLLIG